MKVLRKLSEIREGAPCTMALGAFDGLHRGHMAVIRAAVEAAGLYPDELHAAAPESAVFTFNSSPSGARSVLTLRDKEKLLKQAGVNRLYSVDFPLLRDMEAEEFVQHILLEACGAKALFCGEDFRFGAGARGTSALLRELCDHAGCTLTVVPPVSEDGEKVSSTRIRSAIEAGDMPLAHSLLGRPFGFSLEVIHGNHIGGAVLGTPTINQAIPEQFVLPPFGVYASYARVEGEYFFGVTNVGVKPTVGSDRVLAETWMPDFSGDLYGRRVRLFLLEFLRPEQKFASLEELRKAIHLDAVAAREAAARYSPPFFGETALQKTGTVLK